MARHALFAASLVCAFSLLAAGSASAQIVNIGFERHGRDRSVGIGVSIGHPQPSGHWQIIREKVWVEGRCERVWIEPIYEIRYDSCGRAVRVCVRQGYWDTIQHPGYWDYVEKRVWVEAPAHGRHRGGYRQGGVGVRL